MEGCRHGLQIQCVLEHDYGVFLTYVIDFVLCNAGASLQCPESFDAVVVAAGAGDVSY